MADRKKEMRKNIQRKGKIRMKNKYEIIQNGMW